MTKTKVDLVVDELTFRTFQSEFILETNDAVASFCMSGASWQNFYLSSSNSPTSLLWYNIESSSMRTVCMLPILERVV